MKVEREGAEKARKNVRNVRIKVQGRKLGKRHRGGGWSDVFHDIYLDITSNFGEIDEVLCFPFNFGPKIGPIISRQRIAEDLKEM